MSTSNISTVPPPSRAQTRVGAAARTSRDPFVEGSRSSRGRNVSHRTSILSLSDQGAGSNSAQTTLGTSLPSDNTIRRRRNNWEGLMHPSDDDGDPDSDTDTIRPAAHARKASSVKSLRSLFTPRSADQTTRSHPRPIAGAPEDEEPLTTGLLSSSPPQMNGASNGIEQRLDQADEDRTPVPRTKRLESQSQPVDLPIGPQNGHQPLLLPVKPATRERVASTRSRWLSWPPSPVFIAIFKCSIAYLIASLFTFVPVLSAILSSRSETDAHGRVSPRPAYSAHMVATIVVYFNPAKTLGNMTLALRFCFFLALGASAVSLLSMATIELFDYFSPSGGSRWDLISEMGDWVVCIFYIGGSMGTLAWLKIWVGNPSFNSGCSMAAMILYTVVIKEGALPKLREIVLIVLLGCCIAALVCVLIFPSSATTRLQASISKSLDSFSTLLNLLTSTFLLERTVVKENKTSLKDAVQNHTSAFKKLKSDLAEAKHERVFDSRIRGSKLKLYDAAIGSLARLAQHLNGLRSSTKLQEELIRAAREGKFTTKAMASDITTRSMSLPSGPWSGAPEDPELAEMLAAVHLLTRFREIAGVQMDDLTSRCDDVLEALQTLSIGSGDKVNIPDLRDRLSLALRDFNSSATRAIKRLYAGPKRENGVHPNALGMDEGDLDKEEADDGPNETVFLVYFFLFTLEEFGREALFLLDTVEEIVTAGDVTMWGHLASLISSRRSKPRRHRFLYSQLQRLVPIDPSKLQPSIFPRAKEVHVTAGTGASVWSKVQGWFWELGERLAQPDMRYAIKVGVAGAMLAAPAYTEWGRPMFLEYRGEWALIAFFATMSQTVGQTNFLSFFRIIGTLLGAGVASLFYTLFPDNPIVLPILGWLFSLPCFYIITQMPDYGQASRFTLLAYNLTCLYAYNRRESDIEVTTIAIQRSTTVIVGTLWSALVSRYWWPFTARRELRMGISDFCVDLSYLYSQLVSTYSRGIDAILPGLPEPESDSDDDEETALLPESAKQHLHLTPGVRHFMAMELHLQSQLGTLNDLLKHTKNEPRLKGPFAFAFYKEVLLSTEWDETMRETFVVPVNKQRREMAGNVILYLYTISSGFRLRTPMPPYLPPAEIARQELVQAIRSLGPVKHRSVQGGGKHLLFFAYALAMQEVISELEYLGGMMQTAFGVISQASTDDFDELFPNGIDVR